MVTFSYTSKEALTQRIDLLKVEMIDLGLNIGLNHPSTVALSQKLDEIILMYQKECLKS